MGTYVVIGGIETNCKSIASLFTTILQEVMSENKITSEKGLIKKLNDSYKITKTGLAFVCSYIDRYIYFSDSWQKCYFKNNYEWHEYKGEKTSWESRMKKDVLSDIERLRYVLGKKLALMVLNREKICYVVFE